MMATQTTMRKTTEGLKPFFTKQTTCLRWLSLCPVMVTAAYFRGLAALKTNISPSRPLRPPVHRSLEAKRKQVGRR